MNAYELTKELNKFMTEDEYTDLDKAIFMASNMLRQQADRIAELEKKSKPVAWMMKYRNKKISLSFDKFQLEEDNTNYFNIPLYTTPQTKPLSDEEINEIKTLMEINYGCVPPLEFAWAIEERHGIK